MLFLALCIGVTPGTAQGACVTGAELGLSMQGKHVTPVLALRVHLLTHM